MIEVTPAWVFVRQRRYLALRAGVATAAASLGPSFARGLLPRSAGDQAIVTGTSAAYWLGFASLGVSTVEAVSELVVKARRAGDEEVVALATSAAVAALATGAVAAIPNRNDVPLPLATARTAAWIVAGGSIAGTAVIGTDLALDRIIGPRPLPVDLAIAAGFGALASGVRVALRNRRARMHGEAEARARSAYVHERVPVRALRAVGMGAAVTGGLVALAGVQFGIAESTPIVVSRVLGRPADPVTPLVGHAMAAAL
ncbi:MAG TPA: hypothetical protein VF143_09095, partial [Candidatus Nanopelagicales bacterium]